MTEFTIYSILIIILCHQANAVRLAAYLKEEPAYSTFNDGLVLGGIADQLSTDATAGDYFIVLGKLRIYNSLHDSIDDQISHCSSNIIFYYYIIKPQPTKPLINSLSKRALISPNLRTKVNSLSCLIGTWLVMPKVMVSTLLQLCIRLGHLQRLMGVYLDWHMIPSKAHVC